MEISVEYRHEGGFAKFLKRITEKNVTVMFDVNTKPYAQDLIEQIKLYASKVNTVEFPDEELIPTESNCEEAYTASQNSDYLLAVGSGTLNDMAKSVSTRLGIISHLFFI